MRINQTLLPYMLAAVILLTGCHAAQQTTRTAGAAKVNNPCFIEDITLGGKSNYISHCPEIGSSKSRSSQRLKSAEIIALQEKYASILGVDPKNITNLPLYAFLDEWIGVPYRLGGDSKKGIDCSAFVRRLYDHVYCVNLVRTALEQFNYCSYVFDRDHLKEGDLVFFRTRGKRITHVGVYLGNNYFVHASRTQGVTISNMNDMYWQRYFAGAGTIPVDQG
jgi:cell wall-associated NlpC family hydrolase